MLMAKVETTIKKRIVRKELPKLEQMTGPGPSPKMEALLEHIIRLYDDDPVEVWADDTFNSLGLVPDERLDHDDKGNLLCPSDRLYAYFERLLDQLAVVEQQTDRLNSRLRDLRRDNINAIDKLIELTKPEDDEEGDEP